MMWACSRRREVGANKLTYDICGHVLFSNFEFFDRLFDKRLGDEYREIVAV